MKKLKKPMLTFVIFFGFVLTACTMGANAISVTITDITTKGASSAAFAVKYQEEKMYNSKGVDLLIKTDVDNVSFRICPEFGEEVRVEIPEKGTYYSLNKLLSKNEDKYVYSAYKDAVSKNYIIYSSQDFNLTIKAVVGNMSEYKTSLLNTYDASKETTIQVKKYEK